MATEADRAYEKRRYASDPAKAKAKSAAYRKKHPEKGAAYCRALYLRRRRAGLCWRCGAPANGKSLCEFHAAQNRERCAAIRAAKREEIRAKARAAYRRLKRLRDQAKAEAIERKRAEGPNQ